MGTEVAQNAVYVAGAGTLILTLIIWFIKKSFGDLNSAATDHAVQGATRAQVESLREDISRLETTVNAQSTKIDRLNAEMMKLRLAFIDEQSALLRILAEFNAHGDAEMKARITAEIDAATKRRMTVLGGPNDEDRL